MTEVSGMERHRAQAIRAIADTSRYDAPTEARDLDAECALAAMEAEGLIVVRAADHRGAVEALRAIAGWGTPYISREMSPLAAGMADTAREALAKLEGGSDAVE